MADARSVREVMLGDLVEEAGKLIERLEKVDAGIAAKIDQATKDAAGKAFLVARLSFEAMIKENERKLIDAGRYAAAQVGNEMNTRTALLVAANEALERKAWGLIAAFGGFVLFAGIVGGLIGAKLAGM